jgi:transposase
MIQLTPQTRVFLAHQPADFRCGIDGLCALCRQRLAADPFDGAIFVFRNRAGTALKVLCYDGQGFKAVPEASVGRAAVLVAHGRRRWSSPTDCACESPCPSGKRA